MPTKPILIGFAGIFIQKSLYKKHKAKTCHNLLKNTAKNKKEIVYKFQHVIYNTGKCLRSGCFGF